MAMIFTGMRHFPSLTLMKILVIGSGVVNAYALVWKIRRSPRDTQVYCAPGNAGIGELAGWVPLALENVLDFYNCSTERIGLTVVGPEPLSLG